MPTRRQRRDAAETALATELDRVIDSGDYAGWLARMARFRTYSPGNQMLIAAQRPDASLVAGYRTWQQLGRAVTRNERGIVIRVPRPYWLDDHGHRIPPPADAGDRTGATRKVTIGTGYVFDIAQTHGDPIDISPTAPDRAPDGLARHLHDYCHRHEVTIDYRSGMPAGLSSYWRPWNDTITLNTTLSHGEQTLTLGHELAHREDPDLRAALDARDPRYYAHHRGDCEATAEAAAHTIAALHGFDTTAASSHYIATWVAHDPDRLTQLADRIHTVVDTISPATDPLADALANTAAATKTATVARQLPASSRPGPTSARTPSPPPYATAANSVAAPARPRGVRR